MANLPTFIPANTQTRLRVEPVAMQWISFLDDLTNYIDSEDKPDEVARHRKFERNIRFYRGSQVGYIPVQSGVFQDIPVPANSTIRINNILRYFVDNIVKEIIRSDASFQVAAKKDTIESEGVARLVKALIEDIQKKQWSSSKKQAEAKYAILCGNSFRYSSYSYANSSQMFSVPKVKNRTVQEATTLHVCPECGAAMGEGADPPTSSSCQECEKDVQPMGINIPEINVPHFEGEDQYPVGDVKVEVVDPMEIKLNLHSRSLEESPYLRRSRMVLKEYLQGVYNWAQIDETKPDDYTQNTIAELERLPGNMSNGRMVTGGGNDNRQVRMDEYWVEPVLYGSYKFPADTKMLDGTVIPKGTLALEIFPEGLYIVKSIGKYLDIKDGVKNDHWVHVQWNKAPSSVYADGIDDAIEKQKQHNDAATLVHDNLMNNTAPPILYNPQKINRGQWAAKPGFMVPMKNAGPSDEPSRFVHQLEPRELGNEIHQVLNEQKSDMAMLVGGAFNSMMSGGQAPSTATGLAIVRDAALSHLAPHLDLKGEADVKMVKQWLRLLKKYQVGERAIFNTSDYVELEQRYFNSSVLDEELDVTIRPGSLAPRTDLERRNDVIEALAVGGLPMGVFNPQVPVRLRRLLEERFNLPFDADDAAADERCQQIEIQKLLDMAEVAMKMGLTYEQFELQAAGSVFVNVWVDNHDVHIQFIVRWLKKDKGLNAPDYVKNYLIKHIQEHLQAKGQLMSEANKLQQMGMGANPSQAIPQNPQQAAMNQSGQVGDQSGVDVQAMQADQGFDLGGNVDADTRPNPVAVSIPGTNRVHPVTQKPSQASAPQPR